MVQRKTNQSFSVHAMIGSDNDVNCCFNMKYVISTQMDTKQVLRIYKKEFPKLFRFVDSLEYLKRVCKYITNETKKDD